MPLVSIVIPAYQHGKELPLCLESLFRQSFRDFEVIVVNDGSTDDTLERLRPYRDRLTLINQENRGGNAAKNRGAAEARGEFIIFCDADVIMRPDGLEVLVDALRQHPEAAYAYSSFAFGWKKFISHQFDEAALRRRNYIHTTALIRRARFPGFDEDIRRLQDWDLWLTMLERGDRGFFVDEVLFRCLPHRGGISLWVPAFFYALPLRRLGLRLANLEKYWEAEAVIRAKHQLAPCRDVFDAPRGPASVFLTAFLLFVLLELVSFVGYRLPVMNVAAFLTVVALVAAVAAVRPDLAILAVFGELTAGSQGGYLLSLPVGGLAVSLRMGIFLAFFTVWAAQLAVAGLRGRASRTAALGWWRALRDQRLLYPFLAVLGMVAMGMAVGLARGNSFDNVFFDANAFFFLGLLPPIVAAWRPDTLERLLAVVAAGMIVAVVKSLLILYFFSHRLFLVASTVYLWVRDTRVGEITLMGGDYYRIFFQSQVFAVAAGLVALLMLLYVRDWRTRPGAMVVLTTAGVSLVLSLSRSFWFGLAAAVLTLAIILFWARAKKSVWRRLLLPVLPAAVASLLVILFVYAFPWPARTGSNAFAGILGSRLVEVNDAAAKSRWALLPVLTEAALRHPLVGSGLGTTVTYQTSDPRLLASSLKGTYTTYAFEWGWHDLWLKFGFLGLATYLYFLWVVVKPLLVFIAANRHHLRAPEPGLAAQQKKTVLAVGAVLSVVALLFTNVFSPYLNHPLGLGLLMAVVALGAHQAFAVSGDSNDAPTRSP